MTRLASLKAMSKPLDAPSRRAKSALDIRIRAAGDVIVMALAGHFDSGTVPLFASQLPPLMAGTPTWLVIDLSGVWSVDAAALAALVQARQRCREGHGELALCGLQHSVYLIFELLHLETAFRLFVDEEHAIRTLCP
jgi:anti-anti-sigma factor